MIIGEMVGIMIICGDDHEIVQVMVDDYHQWHLQILRIDSDHAQYDIMYLVNENGAIYWNIG